MKKKLFTLLFALFAIVTTAYAQENTIDGHEYVDLGLPSGTLWATCNVGATKPEEYGLYFAWGETVGYTSDTSDGHRFIWEAYKWSYGSRSLKKYTGRDGKTELDLEDDAAYVNWGSNWRMPSKEQQDELRSQCKWEWTQLNGVYGCKVTGPNGKSIFLPAGGYRYDLYSDFVIYYGFLWSRSLITSDPIRAYTLTFGSSVYFSKRYRELGQNVRPIINKYDISNGIEIISREIGNHNDYYSIDGEKLNGEPKKKGIYIYNGKKVKK